MKPGPGAYQTKTSIGEGPKIPFGVKFRSKSPNDGPGPGKYNPHSNSFSPLKYSFGLKTKPHTKDQTPGPGAYQPPSNLFDHKLGVLDKDKRGELSKSLT